ncbi:MAG: hypothetical protein OXQ86_08805 [Gammaproteobacteria bacterium]|nr:hypothetical protein [Gammaproteobacteria bacterium]MDE0414041.1 hypothetical protein [Gammaproteobacteria bacterium]
MAQEKYPGEWLFAYITEVHAMHVSLIRTVVRPTGRKRMADALRDRLEDIEKEEASNMQLKVRRELLLDLILCLEDPDAEPLPPTPGKIIH